VIDKLKDIIKIRYICEIFDGINCHLSFRIDLKIIIATSDYYNYKQVVNIVM
jgi:hypothetical protein